MIAYIIKSTICLAIVLVVYLLALEREKMHVFNRGYLLFGLLLSMIVAFLPSGEVIEQVYISSPLLLDGIDSKMVSDTVIEVYPQAWFTWERVLMSIYSIGLLVMLIRFANNVYQLIIKAECNTFIPYKGAKLVLIDDHSLPHTFLGYIYVNENQYRNKVIDEKLLAHEIAHVRQRHSWDVLLVELVKAIFWFNPLLILYKRVMQLNHEFLADEAVIQEYKEISIYQHLLVDTCQSNNQIYLASNINFLLTKKRLKMMTKQSSRKRIYILMAGVIPVVIALVMLLGQPVLAQKEVQNDPISKDQYFENSIIHFKTKEGKVQVKSYNALSQGIKDLLPLPPPTQFDKRSISELSPLKKGTIVHLSPDGVVFIANDNKRLAPPTAPPPPPKSPYENGIVPPPPPPKAPLGDVKSWIIGKQDLDNDIINYYLDGKKTTEEAIVNISADDIEKVDVFKDDEGKSIRVYSKKSRNSIQSKKEKLKEQIPSYQKSNIPSGNNDLSFDDIGIPRYQGKTIRELAIDGAEVYLNGGLLRHDVAITLCSENTYDSVKVTDCGSGSIKIEIE